MTIGSHIITPQPSSWMTLFKNQVRFGALAVSHRGYITPRASEAAIRCD